MVSKANRFAQYEIISFALITKYGDSSNSITFESKYLAPKLYRLNYKMQIK